MAEPIYKGRYTAAMPDSFAVFLIGSRMNDWRLWKVRWIGQAMTSMLQTLYAHPEKGFLGGENFFRAFPVTTILVSYWRSFEALERFAHDKSDPHLEAWRAFNKRVGDDGSFGIWHETYLVQAGQYEVLYGNMPLFGLARASQHIPITGRRDTARGRIGQEQPQVVRLP